MSKRSGGMMRRAGLAVLGLAATLAWSAPAHAVVATAASSAYEFDSIPLGAATAAGAAPTFGNGTFVQGQVASAAGNVLTSPGHGFKTNNFAVAGARRFASGFLGGLPRDSGLQVDPGGTGQARSILTTFNSFYGGGGIAILPGTGVRDANVNGTATVNVTTATASFVNPAPAAITLQSGAWFAFSGFLPAGAYGSVGLSASILIPGTGQFFQLPSLVFAIDGPGPGTDFVQANGLNSIANGANPAFYGLRETTVRNAAGAVTGTNFAVYGVSYGPLVTFPALSAPAQVRGTLTVVADPMASIEWDPSILPSNIVLPSYGPDVPEPASASLLAFGVFAVVMRRRRRARIA